jgi:hypothetical protein
MRVDSGATRRHFSSPDRSSKGSFDVRLLFARLREFREAALVTPRQSRLSDGL